MVGDPPAEVQVTVIRGTDAAPLPTRRIRLAALATVLVLAVAGTAVVLSSGGPSRPATGGGAPSVAAAYGYPGRCLSITVSKADPAFARADFNRAYRCGRYSGYATAIFRRSNGLWRPVLDALGYRCPVKPIPTPVQVDLGVCPG